MVRKPAWSQTVQGEASLQLNVSRSSSAEKETLALTSGVNLVAFEALLARMRPGFRTQMVNDLADLCAPGRISFGPPTFDGLTDPQILRLLEETFRAPRRD